MGCLLLGRIRHECKVEAFRRGTTHLCFNDVGECRGRLLIRTGYILIVNMGVDAWNISLALHIDAVVMLKG